VLILYLGDVFLATSIPVFIEPNRKESTNLKIDYGSEITDGLDSGTDGWIPEN